MKQKDDWIISYVKEYKTADVAHKSFVDAFESHFNLSNQSKDIGRRLSKLYKQGVLKRVTYSLKGRGDSPNWVYVYSLSKDGQRNVSYE